MTFEEITALSVEDVYGLLLDRILDFSIVPMGEAPFTLHQDEELSFYDRILIHATLVKPSLEVIEAELVKYKSELEAQEQARLDEIARIEGLTNRFRALEDVRGAITQAGLDIPNPEIELKRIIEDNDVERLSLLESKDLEFQNIVLPKQQRKLTASLLTGLINSLVEIVIEHNLRNNLSSAQKDAQAASHPELFQHLQQYRPAKFKLAVDAITPDGTLVTQDLKDELLVLLAVNGIT